MKTLGRLVPSLMLGLTLAIAGVSFAQSANQAPGDEKHSCCCMTSGCCGDSCQMMKKDAKHHAESSDKDGCCGCCGDSCQMKKKDGVKSPATSAGKEDGCCGDSCHMKDGAKTTTATASVASDKHECCCCGDSCNMKHMKTGTS